VVRRQATIIERSSVVRRLSSIPLLGYLAMLLSSEEEASPSWFEDKEEDDY
jgi:hypothetical protein